MSQNVLNARKLYSEMNCLFFCSLDPANTVPTHARVKSKGVGKLFNQLCKNNSSIYEVHIDFTHYYKTYAISTKTNSTILNSKSTL